RRPQRRRAGRADRLCRPPRHRADHPPEPARRLPAERVPARSRLPRPGRRARRDEGDAGALPPAPALSADRTQEILGRLEARRIRLGLDRMRGLLAELGNPERRFPAVLVAGSNGKGSTAALLAAMAAAAGYRTGLYTSPHLETVEERLRIGGRAVAGE